MTDLETLLIEREGGQVMGADVVDQDGGGGYVGRVVFASEEADGVG